MVERIMHPDRVIVLSPHPDDIEFGCGGLINKLINEGSEVYSLVFSDCAKSVPEGFASDVLIKELYHCPPSQLEKEDSFITDLHYQFLMIENREISLKQIRHEQK